MKLILRYIRPYRWYILAVMLIKLIGTGTDLLMPYVLENLLDHVIPAASDAWPVIAWGCVMLLLTLITRVLNVCANRMSVRVARNSTFAVRRDLFHTALNLSGSQMDRVGLPSLISRMTSDTYNVQSFIRMIQTMGIRSPIMLIGGAIITLTMDTGLAAILCVMAPIMIVLVCFVSWKGIPLYNEVQNRMDVLVRRMRESITGIRVVRALGKEPYEERHFGEANTRMMKQEVRASVIMSLPGPIVTLFLNVGLTLVVLVGARRVNDGHTEPGVILAFLTYFNMILMGVMGLNRIFMMLSKANASANRIAEVVDLPEDLTPVCEEQLARAPSDDALIFDHVSFNYDADDPAEVRGQFLGEQRQQCLKDISFRVKKGGSLGIIGATGSGKTTMVNLLMRFYDPDSGVIRIDGHEIRTAVRRSVRSSYAMVLQDTWVFQGTIFENIAYGKADATMEEVVAAAKAARIHPFIMRLPLGYDTVISEDGGNISKGRSSF